MGAKLIRHCNSIRLPKATGSVQRTLRKTSQMAKEQRWRKVVIIGEGPHGYQIQNSSMQYYTLIGFIAYAQRIIEDEARGI